MEQSIVTEEEDNLLRIESSHFLQLLKKEVAATKAAAEQLATVRSQYEVKIELKRGDLNGLKAQEARTKLTSSVVQDKSHTVHSSLELEEKNLLSLKTQITSAKARLLAAKESRTQMEQSLWQAEDDLKQTKCDLKQAKLITDEKQEYMK